MCRSSQRSTLGNVIENDVCALSMSYLFALKTRVGIRERSYRLPGGQ